MTWSRKSHEPLSKSRCEVSLAALAAVLVPPTIGGGPRVVRAFIAATLCGAVACNAGPSAGAGTNLGPDSSNSSAGTGSGNGGASSSSDGAPVDPGTKDIHRLNSAEYNATIADVLATTLQPADSSWRGGELGGFDNMASVLDVDDELYAKYFDSATKIADDVMASSAKSQVVTCARADDDVCVPSIINQTGLRLFRRPLSAEEVATYRKVYSAARALGETHEGSLKQVLRALLSSAEFLFRIEFDPPDSLEKHPLDGYELASRLSYFLWSSAPDDALLNAAGDGSLLKDDTLTATVDRMLADPVKSLRLVQNFSGQWLGARKLPEHAVDVTVYPDWSPELADALTQEIYAYFGEFLKTDRSWLEFLTADFNFVNAQSAGFYGAAPPSAPGLSRVELTADQRQGFFGLGGFLTLSSLDRRTSPTLRGRWILRNMLCTEPPPPAKNIPDLNSGSTDPTTNVRKALEQHRANPQCASCHALFDPYGLSLEQFDGIGQYRTAYADETVIDPSTTAPNGQEFSGLKGLSDTITADPQFAACVADNLFTYGTGRMIIASDRPYLRQVQERWRSGVPSLRRLIQTLVSSEPFRYRRANVSAAGDKP
jgi:hypothetical protein